jgi:adenylate cyclase
MNERDDPVWQAELPKLRCALLMVDVVGSVSLIRDPSARFVDRWRRFVREVRLEVLPRFEGRMVKSLGDGMLCVFGDARAAACAAFEMNARAARANRDWPAERAIWLREGANIDEVEVDDIDVFGPGVDLTQRFLSLARPGELVASAAFRDELTDGIDARIEDLGECYLKHIDEAQRCFRLLPPSEGPVVAAAMMPAPDAGVLQLPVAVLPFHAAATDSEFVALGDLLADQITTSLSRTPQLRVISRLSCATVAQRNLDAAALGRFLGARYLLWGSVAVLQGRLMIHAEVIDALTSGVVHSVDSRTTIAEVLAGEDAAVGEIVAAFGRAIVESELKRYGSAPLPSLQSHQLLLSAIAHLHRSSLLDFDRARSMLELLAERHGRLPHANSWLANWHAMHAVQGLCSDPEAEGRRAVDRANRALDTDPSSSFALTMRGLVQAFLRKDLAAGESDYRVALDASPSESLAWLYLGTLRAWQGRGAEALEPAKQALRLAPVGPLRYYYESLAGLAALAAGELQLALDLSASSLRANRRHTSTHRTLAIAQWRLGLLDDARATVGEMMRVEPGFTVEGYRRRFPGGDIDFARDNAQQLLAAGAPAR